MAKPPRRYRWLLDEPGPRLLKEALALYGLTETRGPESHPAILAWAAEAGLPPGAYPHDGVPWCGLFLAVIARRAGWPAPQTPLRARSWATFGDPADPPMLGDVLVFVRAGGGHVGLYVGEDEAAFHVLGGNQSDAVTIARIPRARLLAARHPRWRIGPPANRRVVRLAATGAFSAGEA